MTTTAQHHNMQTPPLVLILATYPNGSGSRYVVAEEDVDSELSFYYGLAKVTATPLTPEQTAEVAPVVSKLAELEALIQTLPAPNACTAADRAEVAVHLRAVDEASMDLEILLDSFGFSPFETQAATATAT